ncbi:hypothetical protein Q3G72_024105 [Acer saccharum]|nr:hypothetical protein Q3G72_024105 [Acer saccharum]
MSCEFYIMLLLLITTTPYLFMFLMKRGQAKSQVRPPGPKQLPLIGNLHQIGESPHKSLACLSNEYGPLMFLQLGWVPTIVISSADVARDIFRNHDLVFSGRPELYTANKLSYGGNNISFTTYNEYWRELRKIAIMELLCSKRVQSFHAVRKQEVELMTKFIARSSSQPINLSSLTLVLANNIVCRAIFGKKFDNAAGFDELMRQVQGLLGKTSIADFFPWMEWLNKFNGRNASMDKYFGELDKILDQEIHDHLHPERSKPENEDLIDVLLRIQKDSSASISLTSEHIKAVPIDIFIAGTDTSSATLVWTMTELIRNPSVMRRAQDEIRHVVNGKETVEEDQLPKLIYLKSVLKEALRLHPPAPLVPRETIQDCTVGGYKIPAKTRLRSGKSGVGVIICDHWGVAVAVKASPVLGCSSVELLEAQACLEGLQLALDVGIYGVVLESDAAGVIQLLSDHIVLRTEMGAIILNSPVLGAPLGLLSVETVRRGANSLRRVLPRLLLLWRGLWCGWMRCLLKLSALFDFLCLSQKSVFKNFISFHF